MEIKESGEMYLETILVLSQQRPIVRAIDISEHMNFSKPSVSRALSILKENGYLTVDQHTGSITLTAEGEAKAKNIYEKHRVISAYLISLGVNEKTATDDACKIEHVISDQSFQAIKAEYESSREN